jgi:DNA-binding NarL/FixJ family response regulator
MPLRILIVDDFEPFRRYLHSTLSQEVEFQIVGQASDGLEAVQKAEELQPDLVLLDIGLQKMNGLEAARRIRELAPRTKILCLSQEFCSDMTEAALESGAQGYIHKLRAGSELLPGIRTVLRGGCFVSGTVTVHDDEHELTLASGNARV